MGRMGYARLMIPAMLLAAAVAGAAEKPKGYRMANLGKAYFFRSLEYRTYDQIAFPLREKLAKGKLSETDFKVEDSMMPKGGILSASIPMAGDDPVVRLVVESGAQTVFTCDDSNQKPGLLYRFDPGTKSMFASKDEEHPTMDFECGIRKPLPDTFNVRLETADGEIQGRYGFQKEQGK
jgi:hypothetical protein